MATPGTSNASSKVAASQRAPALSHALTTTLKLPSGNESSEEDRLDRVFAALSHRARRRMLSRLQQGPATAGELAALYSVSLPAISKHLKVLEGAGLILRQVDGRVHHCSISWQALQEVDRWVEHYRGFWNESLRQLAELVEEG